MAKVSLGERLKKLFVRKSSIDEAFFDELADELIEGDLSVKTAFSLIEELKKAARAERLSDEGSLLVQLQSLIAQRLSIVDLAPPPDKVSVFLILGVNGAGKTTTAAKLARYYSGGYTVVLAAADTFRAAAIEQLSIHAQRLGIRLVSHMHGSDPAAVVFDAAESVGARGGGIVLADTAGRLHNKENLVRELQKIERVAISKSDEGLCKKILVIDGTSGQNALRQAEVFHEAVGLDAFVLTKCDSSARGGAAVSVCAELGIPAAFICNGESYEHIHPFDPASYAEAFIGGGE